jgi:hypothetical protein
MSPNARTTIEPLYQTLLDLEKSDGVEASEKALMEVLDGKSFNDVMLSIQES